MKSFLLTSLLLFVGVEEEITLQPIDAHVYSYCNTKKECAVSVTLTNKSPFNVTVESDFFDSENISLCAFGVFEANGYMDAIVNKTDTLKHSVSNNCDLSDSFKEPLKLAPFEATHYVVENVKTKMKLDWSTKYLISFYASLAKFSVNGSDIGWFVLGSSNKGILFSPKVNTSRG